MGAARVVRVVRDPVWRGRLIRRMLRLRRGGSGSGIITASVILLCFAITSALAVGLYLGGTLQQSILPAALQAFSAMFGG